jgi:hypothetical protein
MADSAAEMTELQVVAEPVIEKRIFVVRERQVMLNEDLADLYAFQLSGRLPSVRPRQRIRVLEQKG